MIHKEKIIRVCYSSIYTVADGKKSYDYGNEYLDTIEISTPKIIDIIVPFNFRCTPSNIVKELQSIDMKYIKNYTQTIINITDWSLYSSRLYCLRADELSDNQANLLLEGVSRMFMDFTEDMILSWSSYE